jgi:hypothetical protein
LAELEYAERADPRLGATMIRQSIMIGLAFTLWVLDRDQPAYKRGTFDSYQACVVAGRAEFSLKRLSPNISWQCLPDRKRSD